MRDMLLSTCHQSLQSPSDPVRKSLMTFAGSGSGSFTLNEDAALRLQQLTEKLTLERQRQQDRRDQLQHQQQPSMDGAHPSGGTTGTGSITYNNSISNNATKNAEESGALSVDGLLSRVRDLESQLSVANRVAEFLRSDSWALTQRQRSMGEAALASTNDGSPNSSNNINTESVTNTQVKELTKELESVRLQLDHKEQELHRSIQQSQQSHETIRVLEANLNKVQEQMERKQSNAHELQNQLAGLQTELESCQRMVRQSQQQVQELENEKRTFVASIQTLEQQLAQLQQDAALQQTEAEEELQDQLQEYQSKLERLELQAQQLKKTAALAEQEKRTYYARAVELDTRLKEQQLELQGKEERSNEKENRCAELEAELKALQTEMSELEDHLNKSYNDTLETMVRQIKYLEDKLKESDREAELLQQSVNHDMSLQTQIQEMQQMLALKETQMEALDEKCREQAKRIEVLQEEMAEMEDHLNKSYSDSLESMVKQISDLKTRLVSSNKENEDLKMVAMQLADEKTSLLKMGQENQAAQVKHSLMTTELQEKLTFLQAQFDTRQEYIEKLTRKCEEQASTIQELERTIKDQPETASESSTVSEQQFEELVQQIAALESRLADSSTVLQFLKASSAQAIEEKEFHKAKALDLEATIEGLKAQLDGKESSMCAEKQEWQKQLENMAEMKHKIADLEAALTESTKVTNELEQKARRSSEEKQEVIAKAEQLEIMMKDLHSEMKINEDSYNAKLFEQTSAMECFRAKVTSLEIELKDSRLLADSLRETIQNAEAEKMINEAKSDDLENQIVLLRQKLFRQDGEIKALKAHANDEVLRVVNNLANQIATMELRLTKVKRIDEAEAQGIVERAFMKSQRRDRTKRVRLFIGLVVAAVVVALFGGIRKSLLSTTKVPEEIVSPASSTFNSSDTFEELHVPLDEEDRIVVEEVDENPCIETASFPEIFSPRKGMVMTDTLASVALDFRTNRESMEHSKELTEILLEMKGFFKDSAEPVWKLAKKKLTLIGTKLRTHHRKIKIEDVVDWFGEASVFGLYSNNELDDQGQCLAPLY